MGAKPLRIRFNEVYGVIKIYDGTRYLELCHSWFYNRIYDRIKHLIGKKGDYKYGIIITLQESELIHITLYLLKDTNFS